MWGHSKRGFVTCYFFQSSTRNYFWWNNVSMILCLANNNASLKHSISCNQSLPSRLCFDIFLYNTHLFFFIMKLIWVPPEHLTVSVLFEIENFVKLIVCPEITAYSWTFIYKMLWCCKGLLNLDVQSWTTFGIDYFLNQFSQDRTVIDERLNRSHFV